MELKKCTCCNEIKDVSYFYKDSRKEGKYRARCKKCTDRQSTKYTIKNLEKTKEYRKNYYLRNKQHLNNLNLKNYRLNKEERQEYAKKYIELNKDHIYKNNKEYYYKNLKKINEHRAEYREKNREHIRSSWKNTYLKYKEKIQQKNKEYNKIYYKTDAGKLATLRQNQKRRELGHDPINNYFTGSEFHHLHINNDKSIGIYIPKDLHHSCYHESTSGNGMNEINKLAISWLLSDTILKATILNSIVNAEASL